MRLIQGVRDLNRVPQGLGDPNWTVLEACGQCFAVHEFHHEKVNLLVAAHVVKRGDMRVVQRRDRACFALEAGAGLGVRRQVRRDDFDGDASIEPGIARLVDLAHATGANEGDDFVVPQAGSCGQRHDCSGVYVSLRPGDLSRVRIGTRREEKGDYFGLF